MNVPDIEKASVQEIRDYQAKALQVLISYVAEKSPFYQEHFRKHGIRAEDIRQLSDLASIPPVTKTDLQRHNEQFYCVPRKAILDYSNTSGTEGEAVTIPLSENDLQRLAYNEAISLACAGGTSEEVYQLTTTTDRRFMAGLAYVMGARKLGAGMVRVGPGIPELQWKTVQEVSPTALIVVPSFLLKLIEWAEIHGIDFNGSSVKAVSISVEA